MADHTLAEAEPMIRAILESGGTFTLKPNGTSMLPTIRPNCDAVSIIRPDRPVAPDDILFYKRPDGHFVLHRVREVTPEGYTLCGDNQVQLEKGVQDDWIIGMITVIERPDGTRLERDTPAFAAAARSRRRSYPFRYVRRRLSLLWHRLIGR